MTVLDFTIPANLFAVGIYCLGALLILILSSYLARRPIWIEVIGILTVALAAIIVGSNAGAPLQLSTWAVVWAIGAAVALGMLLLGNMELFATDQRPEAAALMLLGAGGAITLATGSDLLQMAIGLETLSLSAAVLVAMGRGEPVLEGAFKYFVLGTVNFATLIFGVGLVFLSTGSLAIPQLGAIEPTGTSALLLVGILLIGFGLTFKLAAVPNHWAALDAYTSAVPSVAGFVMAVSKLAAALALGRIVVAAGLPLSTMLVGIGILTIIWGTVGAFAQRELRRLLAYSAVAHGGFLALALGSGVEGPQTAVFYAIVYGAMALLVFSSLAGRGAGPLPLDQIAAEPMSRLRTLALVLGLLSLAGIPPTPGFWSKLAVLWTAWDAIGPVPALIAAAGGAFSALYYLRPLPDLLAKLRREAPAPAATSPAVIFAGAAVLVLAVIPGAAWGLAQMIGGA